MRQNIHIEASWDVTKTQGGQIRAKPVTGRELRGQRGKRGRRADPERDGQAEGEGSTLSLNTAPRVLFFPTVL